MRHARPCRTERIPARPIIGFPRSSGIPPMRAAVAERYLYDELAQTNPELTHDFVR